MKRLSMLLVLVSALVFSAYAQRGSVSGKVLDSQSGEPLAGARISLGAGGSMQLVIAGLNGAFLIKNMQNGAYKVQVTYMGYKTHIAELQVNGATVCKVLLENEQNNLQAVEVSTRKDKTSALSAQLADRKADAVQNSVAARTIEVSPDLSVASVVQRVSGVSLERSTNGEAQYPIIRGMDKRYIYTLVNGIKIPSPDNKNRYVPLDIFPADLLDRLEVIKSLTPDKEGDAIAGAVNMIMKDAPEHLSVKANAALGYADKFFTQDYTRFDNNASLNRSPRTANGSGYQATMGDFPNSAFSSSVKHNPLASLLGVSVGGRVFKNRLGIILAGSYQSNYRNVDAVFFKTELDENNGNAKVTDIQRRTYSIQQQRSGLHSKFDFKINGSNKIRLYAAYMNLVKDEYRNVSDTTLNLGRTGAGTGRISNSNRTFHDDQKIVNFTLSGSHKIARHLEAEWSAVYSKASDNRPDVATLSLSTGVTQDSTGAFVKSGLYINESTREFQHNSDEDKSGYLNFTYESTIGNARVDWSAGGMYRNKSRTSTYDLYKLRPSEPSTQLYDGDINHNHFEVFNGEGTSDNALNYDATEKVGAAYGMVKITMHQLELTGGARYEHTDLGWTSNIAKTSPGKTGSITYYDVLPSAILKYGISAHEVLRVSYYAAISRPNFYEIIPHIGGDQDADYKESGNSALKRTTADNFDARYEYYLGGGDHVMGGAFYKRLKNPIEYALETVGTNVYYQPDNFGNASNYGFELDATKFLRSFGVRVNYTYTHSAITTKKTSFHSTSTGTVREDVDQTRPLQGQSAHVANFSLLFKDDNKLGLNAQLAMGYTSSRINTVSQYLNNDVWQKAFAQMDFSLEKRVAHRWYVYAKVNNILNTPYQLELKQPYTGSGIVGSVPYQQTGKNTFVRKDTYGANYLLGVKFKL